ncbi:uncharacterized protein LOC135080515 [Ostrinia nubilalis]|uniref:uncharacterized protein LOC114358844 n=1 Tax=Ostrinia furnacalis TaxID=93504 RepID=UPI00103A100B|nr:uncharacterized protein LOC114358844 [Ostrinia furnacalis]
MSIKPFISRNIVALVMVPMIIGGHYGWYKLQENDTLVSPEEREKLPIIKMIKNMSFSLTSKD